MLEKKEDKPSTECPKTQANDFVSSFGFYNLEKSNFC